MPRVNTEKDFWSNIDKSNGPDSCWEWKLSKSPRGYGKTFHFGKNWRAHRLAYFFTNGYIAELIQHSCDNPSCCNPKHLSSGTHKTNALDRTAKKRYQNQKGINHSQNKFSDKTIRRIRQMRKEGVSAKEISNLFSISVSYVYQIASRKRWKHLE